jgi:hypothetical protein
VIAVVHATHFAVMSAPSRETEENRGMVQERGDRGDSLEVRRIF